MLFLKALAKRVKDRRIKVVKFLIIRFSSIGDIVLTSPVVRCLKNQVENAEIHFLTKKLYEPLVSANPNISKVLLLSDHFRETLEQVRKEEYHYLIDLHHNIRTSRLKNNLRLLSFTFNKLNIRKWLMVNFKINILPDKHIVDRYFETVKLFEVVNDNLGLDYFIPPDDEVQISDLPPAFQTGYIALVTGAGHYTKQMTPEMMVEICNKLQLPVLLLGGKEDHNKAEEIVQHCINTLYNGCGKFSIGQSASLVKQSQGIITPDTGLMHIASAFKKRIISVWGNTIPEFGMYPLQTAAGSCIFEVKGLSCRPCSKIGNNKCPKKHFRCMKDIPVSEIIRTANRWTVN